MVKSKNQSSRPSDRLISCFSHVLALAILQSCCTAPSASAQSSDDSKPTHKPERAETSPVTDGTVAGVVAFQGAVPRSPIPDDAGFRRPLLRVDRETGRLAQVAVWLVPKDNEVMSQGSEPPATTAVMDQRDHEFVPRVLAVRAGQPIRFTNSDPANHNVRTTAFEPANQFNVFTGMDGSYTHRFVAPSNGRPVRVGCDIHPWMRGWIYVFAHPRFAVTNKQGTFRIDSVPAGEYTLVLQQPDIRYRIEESVTVPGGQAIELDFEIREEDLPTRSE